MKRRLSYGHSADFTTKEQMRAELLELRAMVGSLHGDLGTLTAHLAKAADAIAGHPAAIATARQDGRAEALQLAQDKCESVLEEVYTDCNGISRERLDGTCDGARECLHRIRALAKAKGGSDGK